MLISLSLPDGAPCPVHVQEWGAADSERVLFCAHGLTRNGMDFEPLAEVAAKAGFRVIAPDMPGRGKSPALPSPALYNNAVYAALCVQLLQQMGLPRVSWVGTSMGGIIALVVANSAPGLIERLVLNDVGCVISAASLARIGEYVPNNPWRADKGEVERELRARTASFGVAESYWPRFAENSIEQSGLEFRLAYDPAIAHVFASAPPAEDISLWPLWEAVKPIPTLLIRGENSDLLSEETAHAMQATHPNLARYHVSGAGHAPALTTEAEIERVSGFLG